MPVFHTFTAGGKRYMFDANTNVIINLKEDLYFELEKYMQSGYKEITPAIEKLRDRGYLKDRADFEMVHPMDSTLEYSLERCIGTIALQVTQGCNLRCKYCAYSGSYDNRVHSSKRMSKEIAFKAIDFLFDHSIDRDRVSLGFYGGEPLLELDLIKECVKYAKKKSIGKELMFNITSNTTLITDEVLKFLYDNEFSLTVSLDGDRQAHDKNRVFAANGAGTFSVVMQILEKIQTQYPDYMERVHINAVIDPTTDFDCKQIDDTVIEAACKDSGLEDFIKEVSLDHVVGQNGAMLSGGQKQKIALARALVHDKPIIIFDEATSNTDAYSEQQINGLLDTRLKDKTVIVITHKKEVLSKVDQIVVLKEGVVADLGRYDDLVGKSDELNVMLEKAE